MSRPGARERGSAYLLALTVLLVLTGLGIAISRIGATERLLGRARAHRQHALQAADAGLAIATARLLESLPPEPLALELAVEPLAATTLETRVELAAPTLYSVDPCAACEPDQGVARVGFRLSAIGTRRVVGAAMESDHRGVARAEVEATLTLQPWPEPEAEGGGGAGASSDPGCVDPEIAARVSALLAADLNPSRCRLSSGRLEVLGRDPETGVVCAVGVPVCALLTDWRERVAE